MINLIRKLRWLFYFILFGLMLGCTETTTKTSEQNLGTDNALVILPELIAVGGVITLSFPKEHPKNISIRTPDNEWLIVHEPSEGVLLIPAAEFEEIISIKLNVADIKGVKWVDGKKITQTVFTIPGEYLIYMANNLETEPKNTFFMSRKVTLQ